MPELPEVEFARKCLSRWCVGRRIRFVDADDTRLWRDTGVASAQDAVGLVVARVERRAKWLFILPAGTGPSIALHLGMTGKLVRTSAGAAFPRFSRVRFGLEDGHTVHFCDQRMFGRCLVGPLATLQSIAGVEALGPDALLDPPAPAAWKEKAARTSRPVKVHLLDQAVVAGLGNIQVTEALWQARIHPATPARTLSLADWRRLGIGIGKTLRRTLADLGDGDDVTYVEEAGAPNPFDAYGREGEPCPRCEAALSARVIGGRNSVFCPSCQPAPAGN